FTPLHEADAPPLFQIDGGNNLKGAHASCPLVEGTPWIRGLTRTASRSARAAALNVASIMWCAFPWARTRRCKLHPHSLEKARKNSWVRLTSKAPTMGVSNVNPSHPK